MIDIHHHLLWDMDDGASSIETSLAMARMAAADGITHVVCSPHANNEYEYEYAVVADKIDEFQRMLDARSEEHTSELQSQFHLVCRLLLDKINSLGCHKIMIYRHVQASDVRFQGS